ncbi:hypothetical protein [Komagataeibacter oboediens]|uniref:Uncharacterized protein n=1 Tax=Komagataeibacter oboediens TaxID=65958 RepID=A0ABS5SJ32_9PROT|nr:hypothetical protein [Komagataeibacter oboediens]MBL7232914.1 hypothetical protein [Komagataeibacter oboediens]MBT0674238.1 hypothetical protein [Komagataeibacter oboediens]MBT0679399.1 hypothetical protein [Komagataeibacter oboediens]
MLAVFRGDEGEGNAGPRSMHHPCLIQVCLPMYSRVISHDREAVWFLNLLIVQEDFPMWRQACPCLFRTGRAVRDAMQESAGLV